MKITFKDRSYIEIRKTDKNDNILIIIGAKDVEDQQKKIVNSVEITKDQFEQLISEFNVKEDKIEKFKEV